MSSALTHTPESPTVSAHKVISARPHKISFYGHEAWMGEIRVFHRYEWFNGTNWAEIDGVNMTSIGVLT
jgi:N-acetyl-anhydromuramyl-L-alanine amidase AmpD